ncbi:PREDICTED: proliferating cell nuclear antigen-like [Erythranthe guttata]|nr:PREDICTED: proliferating cell nuclear antigen-like [Erythranthe guttata]|eukprot:XP_012842452.1 PREDICTED: proliferating cell nuclear antigen-like [Erythranthe guttata]
MGIDLDRMYNVFQLCGHDDSLTLESVRDYAVKLIFTSPDRDTIATAQLNLVSDFLWTDFVIKDTEPYATVRMPSSGLESMCKMLIVASDTIIISVTKEQVKFSIICDTGAIDYTFVQRTVPADKPEDETVIQMHETMEPVSMMVDLEYLKVFTKATLLSKTVTLKFCPDDNLVVVYQIPRFGFLKFCMPKE